MVKLLLFVALGLVAWWWVRPYLRARAALPDEAEARAILGVSAQAGPEEIRAAHRRLAAAVHPDRGGSTELTRRINSARDVLLKRSA